MESVVRIELYISDDTTVNLYRREAFRIWTETELSLNRFPISTVMPLIRIIDFSVTQHTPRGGNLSCVLRDEQIRTVVYLARASGLFVMDCRFELLIPKESIKTEALTTELRPVIQVISTYWHYPSNTAWRLVDLLLWEIWDLNP